jgi:hypothetical protein
MLANVSFLDILFLQKQLDNSFNFASGTKIK